MKRSIVLLFLGLAACSSSIFSGQGSGFEWWMDTNRITTEAYKTATHTASCPEGMVARSGGYSIQRNPTPMTVVASQPKGEKWSVSVRNNSSESQTLEIVVYVGCVS